jgi:hypothetical protein
MQVLFLLKRAILLKCVCEKQLPLQWLKMILKQNYVEFCTFIP